MCGEIVMCLKLTTRTKYERETLIVFNKHAKALQLLT